MSRLPSPLRGVLGALLIVGSGACIDSTEPDPYDPEVIEEVDFDPSLQIDLSLMSQVAFGVYVQDLVEGEGIEMEVGTTFTANYSGFLSDGTLFDQGDLTNYLFGAENQRLIPGFEIGLLGMKPGGMRRIVIPPDLAYGRQGYPPAIPSGAILVFVVDLVTTTGPES